MIDQRERFLSAIEKSVEPTDTLSGTIQELVGAGNVGIGPLNGMPDMWQLLLMDNQHGSCAVYFRNGLFTVRINQTCKIGDPLSCAGAWLSPDIILGKERPAFLASRMIFPERVQSAGFILDSPTK